MSASTVLEKLFHGRLWFAGLAVGLVLGVAVALNASSGYTTYFSNNVNPNISHFGTGNDVREHYVVKQSSLGKPCAEFGGQTTCNSTATLSVRVKYDAVPQSGFFSCKWTYDQNPEPQGLDCMLKESPK